MGLLKPGFEGLLVEAVWKAHLLGLDENGCMEVALKFGLEKFVIGLLLKSCCCWCMQLLKAFLFPSIP